MSSPTIWPGTVNLQKPVAAKIVQAPAPAPTPFVPVDHGALAAASRAATNQVHEQDTQRIVFKNVHVRTND